MALRGVPWAIGGGAHNPVEGARLSLYAATQGARGVVRPDDMQVTALPVPGGAVRIRRGAAVMPNDYAGAGAEAYAIEETSYTDFPVPATGSSGGATRYLVGRVSDPQFAGDAPENVEDGPYTSYEWLSADPEVNPPSYPWALLAGLDQPASTGTITQSMITDRRRIANPREKSYLYANPTVVATEETLTMTEEKGELFPDVGSIKAPIPEWATRVQIVAEWLQVAQDAGDFNGRIWVEWGPYVEQSVRRHRTQIFGVNGNNSDNLDRAYWKVAQEMYISPDLRGTDQIFFMKGRLLSHSGGNSRPRLDSISGIVLSLRFLEEPDQFTVNE